MGAKQHALLGQPLQIWRCRAVAVGLNVPPGVVGVEVEDVGFHAGNCGLCGGIVQMVGGRNGRLPNHKPKTMIPLILAQADEWCLRQLIAAILSLKNGLTKRENRRLYFVRFETHVFFDTC